MSKQRIRLRGVSPRLEGKFWESDRLLRLGRLDSLEVALPDLSVSGLHAEVAFTEQGWVARDLGSTNGTYLNGIRLGRAGRKLRQRDMIQCGNLVVVVAVLEEEVLPAPDTPLGSIEVQATSQRSWHEAMDVLALDLNRRPRAGDQLLTLIRAGHHLCHIASLDDLLRAILDDAVAAVDAQRGAIVLQDEATGQLVLRAVSTGERDTSSRVMFSRSMAQRSFGRGESLLCRDVHNDPQLRTRSIADGTMNSIICALLRSPRKRLGVLHLDRNPFQEPFTADELHLADALAANASAAIESAQLLEKHRVMFIQTVTAMAQACELRDQYTGGHTQRVTDYSLLLADELELPAQEKYLIQIGTPLHDFGKIGIDDAILRSPRQLTADEFEQMKTHTLKGATVLETIPDLAPILPIVRSHHERWDGKGYPDGLAGEAIPRLARIVAVADAFDAMTTDRPYRARMPLARAFQEVQGQAGTQFDAEVANAFIRLRPRIEVQFQQRLDSDPLMAEVVHSGNDCAVDEELL